MELKFKVPKELEEQLQKLSSVQISLIISKIIGERLGELARLKEIVSRSQLTEQDADELSNKIDISLSKRFKQSLKE